MPGNRNRPPPALVGLLAAAIAIVAIADGVTVWHRHNKAKPVTVGQAIQNYRASQRHPATPAPTPTGTRPSGPPQPSAPASSSASAPTTTPTSIAPTGAAPTRSGPVTTPTSTAPTTPSGGSSSSPTSPTPPAAAALPPPGVYRYATTGSEQTSVPGTSRSFPPTSPVTVEAQGCGESVTWQPLNQHSETQVLCLSDDAVRLASYQTNVSFFGVGSNEDYTCPANSLVFSTQFQPGQTRSFTCTSSDSKIAQRISVIGFSTQQVGGTAVRTLHIHVHSTLSGADSGSSSQDYWLATANTVLVRNTGSVHATQNGVDYKETFDLRLKSLQPQR